MTKAYAITSDIEAWEETPEAPEKLLALARATKRERLQASNVAADLPCNIIRAIDYAKRAAPAKDGSGGNSQTFEVAAALHDLGMSEDLAFELMLQHYNPRCQGPWPDEDLRQIVHNAYSYPQNGFGCHAVSPAEQRHSPETIAKLLAQSTESAVPAGSGVDDGPIAFSDLLGRTAKPIQELVPGLVERGIPTFLSGTGGSNKSRLALQIGLSIDTGSPFLGHSVQPATFVYYSTEDNADEVTRRVQAITRRLRFSASSKGQYFDRVGKDSALASMSEGGSFEPTPFLREMCDGLRSVPGHKFVVLDSCYNFVRFTGKSKLDEGAVNAFIGILQAICTECDCTMLVLWHPSQAGQDRGDASGWSVAWHNAPRARLSITPVKDTDSAFELKVEKRNHGAKGKPLTLFWSGGALLPRGETDSAELETTLREKVVKLAIFAAESGAPIQKQAHPEKWILDEIEREVGRRPTNREVKDILAAALPARLLRYVGGSQHRTAGYYPWEENRAAELAHAAKRGGARGGKDE